MRGAFVATLGLLLALLQADRVLKSLRGEAGGGYGPPDLSSWSGDDARIVLDAWDDASGIANAAFGVYWALDAVFVVAYALLLLRLFAALPSPAPDADPVLRAIRKAPWFVGVLVVADLLEGVLWAGIYYLDWTGLAPVAACATLVKWLSLGAVLLVLIRGQVGAGWGGGFLGLSEDRRWALARMRIPLVVCGLFALVILFDPTGQVADSFRRWFDDLGQFAVSGACTLAGVGLLGVATWTTARRSVIAANSLTQSTPGARRWFVAMVGFAALTVLVGALNPLAIALTIAIVFVLEGTRWALTRGTAEEELAQTDAIAENARRDLARPPAAGRLAEVLAVARFLATLPLVALLIAAAVAWTAPPVVLLPLGDETARPVAAAVGAVSALVLAIAVAYVVPFVLRRADDVPAGTDPIEKRHVVVVVACLAIVVAAVAWPLDVPGFAGPVAMTAVALAVVVIALGEGQRYGDTRPPPPGLVFVGFKRVPVTLLVFVAFALAPTFDDGSYHDIHRNDEPPPDRAGIPLTTAFADWAARTCADSRDPNRTVPLVLVASQGGGIRSAYWTGAVLTDLLGAPSPENPRCPGRTAWDQVFALGGASGGSVGITAYAGRARDTAAGDWYRDAMGDYDFAAIPSTWGLLVDLPRSLIGFDGPDRAQQFEEAWEKQEPPLADDFFATQARDSPLLMPSGTQVETGCRMNMALLRLTAITDSPDQDECAAVRDRRAVMRSGDRLLPTAPLTSDVLDYLCDGGSLNRSTVALTSARFPYVSPSGRLTKCDGGRESAVVDGGYAENTGAQPLLHVWEQLEPLVAEHNAQHTARGDRPLIVPVFVSIDNHYAQAAKAGAVGAAPQALAPIVTFSRADKLDDRGVEQQANAEFSVGLPGTRDRTCQIGTGEAQRFVRIAPGESPGVGAPLGWTLSKMAIDDLDNQRRTAMRAGTPAETLRGILRGDPVPCSPPREIKSP